MTSASNELPPRRSWLARRASHISAAVGLTVLWLMFGDSVTVGNLVLGAVIAIGVVMLLPLPDVRFNGRVRPIGVVRYFLYFFYSIVVASVDVTRLALLPGSRPQGAIVAIPLHTRSEFHVTVTALTLSLIPGSLIVDIDRETSTLYAHVLDVGHLAGVEDFRRGVLDLELRILRAIGSPDDLERATLDMQRRVGNTEDR